MTGPLGRKRILELFDELSKELRLEGARAQTLYESPYLTVTGASAKHLLAMKLLAARTKDRADIAVLCEHLGLEDPDEAIGIYRELFPGARVKATAREALEAAFRRRSVDFGRRGS